MTMQSWREKILEWLIKWDRLLLLLVLPLISIAIHGRVFTTDLTGMHVWRQAQTQTVIQNFYEEDFNILNPRRHERGNGDGIFRMEFPLFQWLVALGYHIFGPSILLTRIFTFLCGFLAIWGFHYLLRALLKDRLSSLLGAGLFALSPVMHAYIINPLPDVLALACGIWGVAFALRLEGGFSWKYTILSAVMLGVAVLVKLPYIILYPVFLAYFYKALRTEPLFRVLLQAGILVLALVPAAAWYISVIPEWKAVGAVAGIFHPDADFGVIMGIVGSHFREMFPRVLIGLPLVPFLFIGVWRILQEKKWRSVKFWMIAGWALGVLLFYLFEVGMIDVHHDYYLLPLVPLFFMLIAKAAGYALRIRFLPVAVCLLLLMGTLPYFTYRKIHPRWQEAHAEFNLDLKRYQKELQQAVPEDALVVVGADYSHYVMFYYLDKKGWCWDDNQPMNADILSSWSEQGAEYLYSDRRKVDEDPEVQKLFKEKVGEWGSVRVYRLK